MRIERWRLRGRRRRRRRRERGSVWGEAGAGLLRPQRAVRTAGIMGYTRSEGVVATVGTLGHQLADPYSCHKRYAATATSCGRRCAVGPTRTAPTADESWTASRGDVSGLSIASAAASVTASTAGRADRRYCSVLGGDNVAYDRCVAVTSPERSSPPGRYPLRSRACPGQRVPRTVSAPRCLGVGLIGCLGCVTVAAAHVYGAAPAEGSRHLGSPESVASLSVEGTYDHVAVGSRSEIAPKNKIKSIDDISLFVSTRPRHCFSAASFVSPKR